MVPAQSVMSVKNRRPATTPFTSLCAEALGVPWLGFRKVVG
jgi:hypothetical protein